jgi:hypothetical protein
MRVSLKTVVASTAAIVALWAPASLLLLDRVGLDSAAQSEALQWALLVVGVAGMAGILLSAWRDTRDPAWRSAHRQVWHARTGASGR